MRYPLAKIFFVFLCVTLLLFQVGCRNKETETPIIESEVPETSSTEEEPPQEEELPPPSIEQPVDEVLSGYPAERMHLIQTATEDGYTVELTFEGLTKINTIALPDSGFGSMVFNSQGQQVSLVYYTDDFEMSHELYQGQYQAEPWSEVSFIGEQYTDGQPTAQVDRETQGYDAVFSPEEFSELAQELFALLEKEMAKRGENLL